MSKLILTVLITLMLSGCDTFYGLNHTSNPFTPMPKMDCVLAVTKSIEGVSNTTYGTEEGSRPLTAHGIEKPDVVHRFMYTYEGLENNFYLSESYNGEVTFSHVYGGLHWVPPQEDIDKISPFFFKLESKLKEECNVINMQVSQYCSGVKCPSV